MELIVVLALIVIIAAISVPVMQTMLTDASVTAAGDKVQELMAEARAHAMDDGRPWRVAYLPGTRVIQIAPDDSTEWGNTGQDEIAKSDLIRALLPDKTYFGTSREDIQNGVDPPTSGRDWQVAAVFMPDGSALDDSFTYFGKIGTAPLRVRLRALTGAVSVEQPRPDQ
jgi:Tfp pilus assembly protein FimT